MELATFPVLAYSVCIAASVLQLRSPSRHSPRRRPLTRVTAKYEQSTHYCLLPEGRWVKKIAPRCRRSSRKRERSVACRRLTRNADRLRVRFEVAPSLPPASLCSQWPPPRRQDGCCCCAACPMTHARVRGLLASPRMTAADEDGPA